MSQTTPPDGNGHPEQDAVQYAPQGQPLPPEQAPPAPPKKSNRGKIILFSLIGAAVFIGAGVLTTTLLNTVANGAKQSVIEKAVEQLQAQVPQTVDEITTLTAVTAEPSAIRYDYLLAGDFDPASVTEDVMRSVIQPMLCSTDETLKLLKQDVAMRYVYTIDGDPRVIDVTFTKDDC